MADKIEFSTTGKPHPYHIVRPSIWPLVSSFAGGLFALMMILYMMDYREVLNTYMAEAQSNEDAVFNPAFPWKPLIGVAAICICMFFWWKDIIFESMVEKVHNKITEIGLRYGMALFIASEVMFFVAFFWAFFDASLYPTEAINYQWPPETIEIIDPFYLPFLMTMILLLSGCTVTWAHHAVLENNQKDLVTALGLSVFLGVFFLCFQVYEYGHATFGFTEGIYPSTFYMATGFHGFHVFVGTVFLAVCWRRAAKGHFTAENHFGFEAAAWYWHFVDVVWLFLFVAVYIWGGVVGIDLSESMTAVLPAASN